MVRVLSILRLALEDALDADVWYWLAVALVLAAMERETKRGIVEMRRLEHEARERQDAACRLP